MAASDLTVILPTLNEAGNIALLIRQLRDVLPGCRVLVVDDNSTDGTPEIVRGMARDDREIVLIERTGPSCLTASIMTGVRSAATEYVAWMDADLSHPPAVLPQLYEGAKKQGCAIASRYLKNPDRAAGEEGRSLQNDSLLSSALSSVLNFGVYRILRLRITDYTSGFIVCRRSLIADHAFVGDYGEYFIELMYFLDRTGTSVQEVPFDSPPRTWGESKTGTTVVKLMRRGVKYLWMIIRLVLPKPLFGGLSLQRPSLKRT